MRRRFYTIFILPHAHARFRKLHLSRNFVAVSCAVLLLGLVGGGVAPHLLFRVQAQSVVLSDLEAENRALSERRAMTVLLELVVRGVRADSMTAEGYGESIRVADNDTAEGRARNRRITFDWTE